MATSGKDGVVQRRRNLTYREKLAIIRKKEEEPAWTQRVLALWAKEHLRLASKPTQATISNLLRDKDKVLASTVPPGFCSARRVRHPELDQRVLLWVRQQLQRDAAVTRAAVGNRAAALAREMQLPTDVTFSKGWVSSFLKRHQLNLKGGNGPELSHRQGETVRRTKVEVEEEEEDHAVEVDDRVEEDSTAEMMEKVATVVEESIQSSKRRRVDISNDSWEAMGAGMSEEGRATAELLLDWIPVPGSYSRWWLMKQDTDKEPLCEEINSFLRSHGLRGMSSVEIIKQLTMFVATFQAAHMWLRQTRRGYPLDGNELTLEQEGVKSHVLQMCPHYERLASVLAPYVDYDSSARGAPTPPSSTTVETPAQTIHSGATASQADSSDDADSTPKPPKKSRQQSTDDSADEEAKAQKRRLFELECTRLESEIETRKIRLVLEKTLARKKLLDAGISLEEVDRIFPL